MNKTLNQDEEIRNLGDQIFGSILSGDGFNLPSTLDGLTMDTEMRVLHVYANISKPANLLHACFYESINCISINFVAPESDPTDIDITPSRTSSTIISTITVYPVNSNKYNT